MSRNVDGGELVVVAVGPSLIGDGWREIRGGFIDRGGSVPREVCCFSTTLWSIAAIYKKGGKGIKKGRREMRLK